MSEKNPKNIVWAIRIFVSLVFILSAYAKLYPSALMGISTFEVKYLGGMGIKGDLAKIASRLIIGLEFSIAILLLLPYYLKKIVIPSTIALLSAFTIHLAIQAYGGLASNCGCFGDLIPMTPLQAMMKNIFTIGLLIIPLTKFKKAFTDTKNIHPIFHVGLSVSLLMFIFILPQGAPTTKVPTEIKKGESQYSIYFDDVAEEDKLLCFFSPTCEHCMATGKELFELQTKYPDLIPEVRILFMDEEGSGSVNEIKQYFDFVGTEFEYKVLTIEEFIPLFWGDYDFPGIKFLRLGEERLFFDGSEDNKFNADKLIEEIKKEH